MRSASSAEPDEGQHRCARYQARPVPFGSKSATACSFREVMRRESLPASDTASVSTTMRQSLQNLLPQQVRPRSDEIESRSKWRISLAAKADKMRGALVS
jgi:hypothetical protein